MAMSRDVFWREKKVWKTIHKWYDILTTFYKFPRTLLARDFQRECYRLQENHIKIRRSSFNHGYTELAPCYRALRERGYSMRLSANRSLLGLLETCSSSVRLCSYYYISRPEQQTHYPSICSWSLPMLPLNEQFIHGMNLLHMRFFAPIIIMNWNLQKWAYLKARISSSMNTNQREKKKKLWLNNPHVLTTVLIRDSGYYVPCVFMVITIIHHLIHLIRE